MIEGIGDVFLGDEVLGGVDGEIWEYDEVGGGVEEGVVEFRDEGISWVGMKVCLDGVLKC